VISVEGYANVIRDIMMMDRITRIVKSVVISVLIVHLLMFVTLVRACIEIILVQDNVSVMMVILMMDSRIKIV
jgi:hypothetical protein